MNKLIPRAALGALALLAAACGGTINTPPAQTFSPTIATVAFKVTVPQARSIVTSGSKRPNFTAPANTTSVSFTVMTVNGTSYTGSPSTFNLTGASCTTSAGTTTCALNVVVPAGDDVIQIKAIDASGNTTGLGNVAVTASNGGTIAEPATLGGTVASISVSAFGEEGVAGTYPVVVTAYDSTGAAIIGTYSAPVTLADGDTTGHTTLSATNIPDSATGASLTLKYDGAQMTAPVTISATASGISASNIANATFPDETYPTVNNATGSIEVDFATSLGHDGSPSPAPIPTSTTLANTTQTGQSLTVGGTTLTKLVSQSTVGLVGKLPGSSTKGRPLYYAWTPQGDSLSYGYVGYSITSASVPATESELCAAPYTKLVVLPLPAASWNALAGSGPCTFALSETIGGAPITEGATFNSDGSYVISDYYDWSPIDQIAMNWTINADASAVLVSNINDAPLTSTIITLPAPSPNASTVTALVQTFPGPIPSPGSTTTPAPVATTAPNPWPLASPGLTGPPNPLSSDIFTPKGTASLPTGCRVSSALLGSSPAITEVDEHLTIADPSGGAYPNYVSIGYQHFYLNGVGEVCTSENVYMWFMDGTATGWYTGTDRNFFTEQYTSFSYLTNASLQASFRKTQDFAQTMPAAAQALTSTNMAQRQQQFAEYRQELHMAIAQHKTLRAILSR